MADKHLDNDEYQFADLDDLNHEPNDDHQSTITKTTQTAALSSNHFEQIKNASLKRKASALFVVVVLVMLIFKFIASFIPQKAVSTDIQPQITPKVSNKLQASTPVVVSTLSSEAVNVTSTDTANSNKFSQKILSMENSQQSMLDDINEINSQINTLNTNLSNLGEKIANLSQSVAIITEKLEQQSTQVSMLAPLKDKKITKKLNVTDNKMQTTRYFINAIIPGRAWLITGSGSTLTVSEGNQLPGFGIIKLIDANQGQVLTSSGKVITFSQQDS